MRQVALWQKMIKWIGTTLLTLAVLLVLLYSTLTRFFPQAADRYLPFQMFTVVTESMVPTIPVDSLVITRRVASDAELVPGTIITFRANRFGQDIVLTHYLDSIEDYEGQSRYRTHAEGTNYKDDYITLRDDILGVYVAHFPGFGKVPLFLKSTNGMVALALIFGILYVSSVLQRKVDTDGLFTSWGFRFQNLKLKPTAAGCCFEGDIKNTSGNTLRYLKGKLRLFDQRGHLVHEDEVELVRPNSCYGELNPKCAQHFVWRLDIPNSAKTFQLELAEAAFQFGDADVTNQKKKSAIPTTKKRRIGKPRKVSPVSDLSNTPDSSVNV